MTVNVVAVIKAKPGRESAVEGLLRGLVDPSRKDRGCIRYDLHRSLDETGLFLFYETWESKELLEEHLKTPHLLEWRSKSPDLLEHWDVKVLEKLS